MCLATGYDFNLVAVLDAVGEGDYAAIDLGTTAAVPDLRMHVIGEIQRRRIGWQLDHIALGTDRIHMILEKTLAKLLQ